MKFRKFKLEEIYIEEAKRLYSDGATLNDIGKKFNVCGTTIGNLFRLIKVPIKKTGERNRIYNMDEGFLNKIDKPWLGYLCGFLWTDGFMDHDTVGINLSIKDIDVLEYFNNKIFNGKKPLKFRPPRKQLIMGRMCQCAGDVLFRIHSKKVTDRLRELGLYENKSLTIDYPNFKGLESYFILGAIDGDGGYSFNINKKGSYSTRFKLSGSFNLLSKIKEILHDKAGIRCLSLGENSNIYELVCTNLPDLEKLFTFLYKDRPEFFLKRKYEILKNIVEWKKTSDLYSKITQKGIVTNGGVGNIRLNYKGEFIGTFNTVYEAMNKKIELMKKDGSFDKLICQSVSRPRAAY